MISCEHITVQFGERYLFNDISFTIGPHDRIGLVGPNGSGKTTLLRILADVLRPDQGAARKASYVSVGYLPQEGVSTAGRTLYAEAEQAFGDIVSAQHSLHEAQSELQHLDPESEKYSETLEIVGELQHQLEDLDAYRMQSKIERVLMGLGFEVTDFKRMTDEFSGGWQMRIELAKLLLREPSVLLLDEPTNHLDIDSLQWLEEYLRSYEGAVVLVSHDRALLDELTTRTLAIARSTITEFSGNYSFYERENEARKELLDRAYKNQQKELKRTQQFIDRFRYKSTKARQVQSRIKRLEKMELIEPEDGLETVHFKFPPPPSSGRVMMKLKNVVKSYGSQKVFEGINYTVERGDKIAVVGVNGAGKSTFARIIAGTEPFNRGERIPGHNMVLSYFAQHQAEELDPGKQVIDIVDEVAQGDIRQYLRSLLGAFLFHGDDVFKNVSILSGGEKSRLALAKMLLSPANFLVLDEPTNHLDMQSKSVLQRALKGFTGTCIIVSHDRAFLDPLVTKVVEISKAGLKEFRGNVSDYLYRKANEKSESGATAHHGDRRESRTESAKERRRREAEERQRRRKELGPVEKQLEKLEEAIESAEKRRDEIERIMGTDEFFKRSDSRELTSEYRTLQDRLKKMYGEWEKLGSRLAEKSEKKGSDFPKT